jgi:hypothetical protein
MAGARENYAQLVRDEKVLVHGGAGGVGYAVQRHAVSPTWSPPIAEHESFVQPRGP